MSGGYAVGRGPGGMAGSSEESEVVRSRPLCPYPLAPRYLGGDADPNKAESFVCGEPGNIVRSGPSGL